MKTLLVRPASAPQASRPAASAAASRPASGISNRAMREALTGMNALPRQPLPPAFRVQLMHSTTEDTKEEDEQPERWARKRAKAQREPLYSGHDDQREGEERRELVVEDLETFDPEASNDLSSHAKDNAPHGDNKEARAPWDRAEKQQAALAALAGGTASRDQRAFLIEEIRRQVPDVAYMEQVDAGARTVLTLIIPGNGPLGVKTLNDDLVGYQINNSIIAPHRNAVVKNAFLHEPTDASTFVVTEQTYKSTTVTSALPPSELRAPMKKVLAAIDRDVRQVYLNGLKCGLSHWEDEPGYTPDDKDGPNEEARRVANIQKAISLVEADAFQLDFQFGMAAIEGGAGSGPPDYAAAVAARLQSSQAALMSRDLDQDSDTDTDTDVGDRRGQIYKREAFLDFCSKGESFRDKVGRRGGTLTYHGHTHRVFFNLVANRDLLRDVRKGKIQESDVREDERPTLELFKRYFRRINVFDNIRNFTSKEVEHVGEQIQQAQQLIKLLERGESVDAGEVTETLHKSSGMNEVVPKNETASEAVFYNAERNRANRIIVSCDIRDMGVDLVQDYEKAMHRVGSRAWPRDRAAQQASDEMDGFRRRAIRLTRQSYKVLVEEAIREAEQDDNTTLAEQLSAEREPSLLMGGDEITLSLHKGMRRYVPRLAAALNDPYVARARVAISTTGNPAQAVDDHIVAQQRADPAHSVLKDFEAEQRDLELTVVEIDSFTRKRQGNALIEGLGLNLLYAENEGKGIVLRRNDTNEVVDTNKLHGRIVEVKRQLRRLRSQP